MEGLFQATSRGGQMSGHTSARWPSAQSRLRGRERLARAALGFFRFGERVSSRYAHVKFGEHATLKLRVEVEEDPIDGGFIAKCVDLPGCVSQGENVEEALDNIVDAIGGVLQARMERHVKHELPALDDDLRQAVRQGLEIPVA
jgi:predicted RNase H-like HicB family nuclease